MVAGGRGAWLDGGSIIGVDVDNDVVGGGGGGATDVVAGGGGGGGGATAVVEGRMIIVVVDIVCTADDVCWLRAPQSKFTRFPDRAWPSIVLICT